MKNIFNKGKLKSVLVALFMVLSVFLVSACSYSDQIPNEDEGGTSFIADITGFKVNYRPELFEVTDFYHYFSLEILSTLSDVFGNANFDNLGREEKLIDGTPTSVVPYIYEEYEEYRKGLLPEDSFIEYKVFEQARTIFFIDDIRNSVIISSNTSQEALENYDYEQYYYFAESEYANNSWKWTHKIENGNTHGYDLNGTNQNNAGLFFGNYQTNSLLAEATFNLLKIPSTLKTERLNYYNFFTETYAPALQVAILQILLERTPTQFAFDFQTNTVMPNPQTLLGNGTSEGLKYDYKKYVEFVGISEEAKTEITNYLLESVIGEQKYNNEINNFNREDYEDLINEIIWNGALKEYNFSDEVLELANQEDLGSIYNVYPAVVIQDYPSYSLFVQSQDNKAFEHITSGQYRSVVLMPSKTNHLYTLMFYLAANREISVNLHYRYYDAERDLLFESPVGTTKTYVESSFSYAESAYIGLLFKDEQGDEALYKMTKFNNDIGNGILKASSPKKMNFAINEYYEQSSKGGFGLNHLKFKEDQSSFFEIIFETDASQQALDNKFKVGIQGVWARDPNEFYS